MRLEPILARLAGAGVGAGGLGSLLALRATPPQFYPAVFVAPDSEAGEAVGTIAGIFDQRVQSDFLVAIYLDANSATVDADLAGLRDTVEAALAGWAHPDAEGAATSHVSGKLFEMEKGAVAWMSKFRTRRRIRCRIVGGEGEISA